MVISGGKWKISEQEFQKEFQEASRRHQQRLENEPRCRSVAYDARTRRVVVKLVNGCTFMFSPQLLQGLVNATASQLHDVQLRADGLELHWPSLDQQFTLSNLMRGIFGTRAWMSELGRKGGSVRSAAKAQSSRINGCKGGRPRKRA